MKSWMTTSSVLVLAALVFGFAPPHAAEKGAGTDEAPKAAKGGPLCPVGDEAVDFLSSTDTPDGPVYFCCDKCIETYKSSPEKYAAKVTAQREALAKLPHVQVTCPLMRKPFKTDKFVEHKGEKVYFCCSKCQGKFEAEPDKYKGKVAAAMTYQTKCPVDSTAIDPAVYLEVKNGKRIYFNKAECRDQFTKDPGKYLANLEAQGVKLTAADVASGKAPAPER